MRLGPDVPPSGGGHVGRGVPRNGGCSRRRPSAVAAAAILAAIAMSGTAPASAAGAASGRSADAPRGLERPRAAVDAAAGLGGSLVYIRRGNVWLAAPDGSRNRPVTRGGGWSSPSQSDSGTIVALRRRALVRLTRDGRMIGRPVPLIGTSQRSSGNLLVQAGPADLRVSPNGKLAAYWIGVNHQTCNPVTSMCDYRLQDDVVVTRVDRFTSFTRYGLTRDYREPSWYSNELLLMFNYGLAETVAIDRLGEGDANLAAWFSDPQGAQLGKGQAAARAPVLAVLAGTNRAGAPQETIRLYAIPGGAGLPVPICQIVGAMGGRFTDLTWQRNGRALAWQEADGIHVAPVPDLAAPNVDCTAIRDRRVLRGSEPFWGPKAVGRRDGLRR